MKHWKSSEYAMLQSTTKTKTNWRRWEIFRENIISKETIFSDVPRSSVCSCENFVTFDVKAAERRSKIESNRIDYIKYRLRSYWLIYCRACSMRARTLSASVSVWACKWPNIWSDNDKRCCCLCLLWSSRLLSRHVFLSFARSPMLLHLSSNYNQ